MHSVTSTRHDRPKESSEMIPRVFSKMMFQGNVSGALNFLSRESSGAPLKLDDIIRNKRGEDVSVRDALMALHPEGKPIETDALLHNCLPNTLPSNPDCIEA